MRQAIATVKKTKEIQEKYKVFTKKSFGQNFIMELKDVLWKELNSESNKLQLNRVLLKRLPMQQFNQEMNWFLRLVLELGL